MLSHIDDQNQPTMVNIGRKEPTRRIACAQSRVTLPIEIGKQMADGELKTKKGPVFRTATLAGIMGAKKTSELIPLCHPVGLADCKVEIRMEGESTIIIDCTAEALHQTGVEMEALTGASVAALTVYDMLKALSHDIVIHETKLMSKTGGKRDFQRTSP